eukprot:3587349-Pyramimonas_sp.AAC.1
MEVDMVSQEAPGTAEAGVSGAGGPSTQSRAHDAPSTNVAQQPMAAGSKTDGNRVAKKQLR